MCTKTPKAPKQDPAKKPQYLRNPLLDGLSLGETSGRNSLRVDLTGASRTSPFPNAIPTGIAPPVRIPTPVTGRFTGLGFSRAKWG